jgi:hypothetical protein
MAAQILIRKFEHIQLLHVPRSKNSAADALAKLATSLVLPEGESTLVKNRRKVAPSSCAGANPQRI